MRKKNVFVSLIPPLIANALIVPPVLIFVYQETIAYPLIVLTVTLGEIISCVVPGGFPGLALKKNRWFTANINR